MFELDEKIRGNVRHRKYKNERRARGYGILSSLTIAESKKSNKCLFSGKSWAFQFMRFCAMLPRCSGLLIDFLHHRVGADLVVRAESACFV